MHTYSMTLSAALAQPRRYRPLSPSFTAKPAAPAPQWPAASGLTRAQLREIVIDQLG